MRYYLTLTVALFVETLTVGAIAADPTAWLPADVNAVVRINVADLYQTPLAKKEGWIKKATESFIDQSAFIPPGTSQIVIGGVLDVTGGLTATRKYSVLVPEANQTLEKLSAWLPEPIETLMGKPMAQFGTDGYVVDAGDGCWLTTAVSSRQSLSRWLRAGTTPGGTQLSRYLKSALKSKENTSQFLMVVDLQDSFSSEGIRGALKETDWFVAEAARDNVAKVLESVQGITIGIRVDGARVGNITVDFEKETGVLKPVLEKMVKDVTQRLGIVSDDLDEWKWSTKGTQVIGTGPVSPGGGRKILSVLDPPSITHAISASSETTPENKMAKTTLKFSKSMQVLLDDLQLTLKKTNDNQALYFERYARKIDELPTLQVDHALLDYAAKVTSSLRYQAQVQRQHLMNAGTRNLQTYASSSSYVGPYGWYASMPNAGVGVAISSEENQAAKEVRFSEWKQIEDGLVQIRRAMTDKYQIEF